MEKMYLERATEFKTRNEGSDPVIEGYFSVFNQDYELWGGATESIAQGAFDGQTEQDVRALINHDTSLVLGRTKAGTLELRQDEVGLFGTIHVNPNDTEAMNCYERVKRGDVSQCSFGFNIRDEETEYGDDGTIHWTIKAVDLFEVSVCTFPAYQGTSVTARENDVKRIREQRMKDLKDGLLKMLKGENEWH